MLEPELFSFKPPLNKHTYTKKSWDKILVDAGKYGLTHSVSISSVVPRRDAYPTSIRPLQIVCNFVTIQITVVLPDTLFIPDYIGNMFSENGQYYMVENVTLGSLIDPGFVTSFVKNGTYYYLLLPCRVYKLLHAVHKYSYIVSAMYRRQMSSVAD